MSYQPAPTPIQDSQIREYLGRELARISAALRDDNPVVFYRSGVVSESSLSAADSANYKADLAANVYRFSTSSTVTLTGWADKTPNRERVLLNVGTGVLVLKSEASESSASHRFALPVDWQLSANAACCLWYDAISSRHRGLSRT